MLSNLGFIHALLAFYIFIISLNLTCSTKNSNHLNNKSLFALRASSPLKYKPSRSIKFPLPHPMKETSKQMKNLLRFIRDELKFLFHRLTCIIKQIKRNTNVEVISASGLCVLIFLLKTPIYLRCLYNWLILELQIAPIVIDSIRKYMVLICILLIFILICIEILTLRWLNIIRFSLILVVLLVVVILCLRSKAKDKLKDESFYLNSMLFYINLLNLLLFYSWLLYKSYSAHSLDHTIIIMADWRFFCTFLAFPLLFILINTSFFIGKEILDKPLFNIKKVDRYRYKSVRLIRRKLDQKYDPMLQVLFYINGINMVVNVFCLKNGVIIPDIFRIQLLLFLLLWLITACTKHVTAYRLLRRVFNRLKVLGDKYKYK